MDPSKITPGDRLWWNRGLVRIPCRVKELWVTSKGNVRVRVFVTYKAHDGNKRYDIYEVERSVSPKSLSVPFPS